MKIEQDYRPLSKKRVWKKPAKKALNLVKKLLENPDLTAVSGTITRSIPTKRASVVPNYIPEPL